MPSSLSLWSVTPIRWDALLFVWALTVPVSAAALLAAYQVGERPNRRMQIAIVVGAGLVSLAFLSITLLRRWPGIPQLVLCFATLVVACILVGRRWDELALAPADTGIGAAVGDGSDGGSDRGTAGDLGR